MLFQGFCFLKYAKNDLKMRCQNVKLFLREPLAVAEKKANKDPVLKNPESVITNKERR